VLSGSPIRSTAGVLLKLVCMKDISVQENLSLGQKFKPGFIFSIHGIVRINLLESWLSIMKHATCSTSLSANVNQKFSNIATTHNIYYDYDKHHTNVHRYLKEKFRK
jgi:hypothetical protein